MKFTLPDGVFPAVRLSKNHQDALVDEAEMVVTETVAANEAFLAQGSTFRSPTWRLRQQQATWRGYRETAVSFVGSRREQYSGAKCGDRGVSLMVLHGTLDGTLDDSMFGAFAATDQAWKWRSSHVNDRLDDARILATVRGPSRQDPFRFLGIKWFAKEHPAVLTGILQRRDFLIMEATGLTQDSKGEKVGYFLMHSVTLRAAPELSEMSIIRGELSFCFILRQSGQGKVDLYCRGFTDPRGDMMERVSVAIAAEALICAAGVVDYANIKKLTWLMKHKGSIHQRQSGRDPRPGRCESCNKSFTKFALIAVAAGTATAAKGATCQICRRVVCAKCSVVKKMTVDVSDTGVVKQCALRFCLRCLLEAKQQSAWEMALNGLEAVPESSSTTGSGSSPCTPHPQFSSMRHKFKHRYDTRTYSEYQRAGTRVYRQGAMATDFRRANNVEQPGMENQQRSSDNVHTSGRFTTGTAQVKPNLPHQERKATNASSPAGRTQSLCRSSNNSGGNEVHAAKRYTFPAVVLSKEKQAAFIDEAETVVREAIAANEEFLAGGAIFRDPKWKLVRAKEGLSVYRQRRSAPGISRDSTKISKPSSPPSQSSSLSFKRRGRAASDMHWAMSTEEESSFSESTGSCIQDKMKRPEVSLMVMHGIMDGSLADCMYGTFAPTNRSWMWRCSHLNERFDDSRILANIMGPTRKDPFRSLGIKWFVKETPAVLTGIVQQRDYLVLEGTGLTRDSRGDTVGYYLLHSVSLSEIPALSDLSIIRGQMSFCFVDRQCGTGRVELYCRGFIDPCGGLMDRVSVAMMAESLLSSAGVIDFAYIKKLAWLMKHKGALQQSMSGCVAEMPRRTSCESCGKTFTKFALTGVGSGAPCHICRRVVCSKCSVVKKMTVDVSSTGSVKRMTLRFCLGCMVEAKEKSVWELALSGVDTASECMCSAFHEHLFRLTEDIHYPDTESETQEKYDSESPLPGLDHVVGNDMVHDSSVALHAVQGCTSNAERMSTKAFSTQESITRVVASYMHKTLSPCSATWKRDLEAAGSNASSRLISACTLPLCGLRSRIESEALKGSGLTGPGVVVLPACNVHNCFGLPSEERSAMKFTLPENAFPDVNLSKEHQNALIDEAEKLVRETLEANEAFLADGAKFRDPRWRMVCAKDGLNVYHRQRPRPKSQRSLRLPRKKAFSPVLLSESHATNTWGGGEVTTDDEASVSSSSTQEAVKRPAGFEMILHGTVDGILDDAMYGTFAATDQAWMWRSSHINDRLDDARVLATIRGPTREDPFRFLGVKWFVKERPVVLTSLVQQRDYLILEATGLTRDSKGEKVGYYLMHSISLPRIFPELTELGLLRGDLSLCFIDRQLGHNKVEKYCRNFSNPRGKIPDRVAVAVTADALICAANVIDYAYIKKLTWLMKEKGEEIAARHCRPSGESRPKCCQNCSKGFSKFALPGSRSGVDCQICRRVVCGRCNVTKKMTVDVSETGSVKQCALRFCLECIREAKEKSVWEMAISGIETSSETSSASGSGLSGRHR
ncbi:hypothetical protein ON010_g4527 [Phytophthora cinnamomi]|nr:hypothetical protein ON010_g4527 [Phytophthora cinnamomi]